jgi:hypothetical protein
MYIRPRSHKVLGKNNNNNSSELITDDVRTTGRRNGTEKFVFVFYTTGGVQKNILKMAP